MELTIGDVAARTGLAASAIRHYESIGLVYPARNRADQRRFSRADIRRLSFIRIAQSLGFALPEIRQALAPLPRDRAPTKRDWERMSRRMARDLDARIAGMVALRDRLDGCIGCGCLSLDHCALYNPDDAAARKGTGPRYLMGDAPLDGAGAPEA